CKLSYVPFTANRTIFLILSLHLYDFRSHSAHTPRPQNCSAVIYVVLLSPAIKVTKLSPEQQRLHFAGSLIVHFSFCKLVILLCFACRARESFQRFSSQFLST